MAIFPDPDKNKNRKIKAASIAWDAPMIPSPPFKWLAAATIIVISNSNINTYGVNLGRPR